MGEIPLSLYIHIPWCVKKCPYCDFNSHAQSGDLPVAAYVSALLEDLENDLHFVQGRRIESIFFGGGTPSLFPAAAIGQILEGAARHLTFAADIEITLECNPGTAEYCDFSDLRGTGVNRLSFGAQSFNAAQLKTLGRIHSADEIKSAIDKARASGFKRYNIDLMHGLPQQSIDQAKTDLEQAIALDPEHLSWYQLTLEPNTVFHSAPPKLPNDDILADIYEEGQNLLSRHGFGQYEVSAYAQEGAQSRHNVNYWEFGDYLGIGAGAHSKISFASTNRILRFQKTRLPDHYLDTGKPYTSKQETIPRDALALEFMMNALRLRHGYEQSLFEARTGLQIEAIEAPLREAEKLGLLTLHNGRIDPTSRGHLFLNDLVNLF
jgi:oxygen-independent coproporphyrinogen-3 oxidase